MTTMTKQLGLAASLVLASNFAVANVHNLDSFGTSHPDGTITYDTTFDVGAAGAFTDTLNFTNPGPLNAFMSSIAVAPTVAISEFTGISLAGMNGDVFY